MLGAWTIGNAQAKVAYRPWAPEPNEVKLAFTFQTMVGCNNRLQVIVTATNSAGMAMSTARLLTVHHGVSFLDLHLAPNGRPVASWIDDRDIIRTVVGLPTGALGAPVHYQGVRDLSSEVGIGFAHDDEGDTIFAYLSGSWGHTQKLMMMTSTMGRRFIRPRAIASIPPESGETWLYAGGRHSLLAIWTHTTQRVDFIEHFYARRGSVFGALGATTRVDETHFPYHEATGFLDARGESVIIHRAPAAHHPSQFELIAYIAPANGAFQASQVAPRLRNCGLNEGEELEVKPIVTNSDGQAVFTVTCEGGSSLNGHHYLIRYTP